MGRGLRVRRLRCAPETAEEAESFGPGGSACGPSCGRPGRGFLFQTAGSLGTASTSKPRRAPLPRASSGPSSWRHPGTPWQGARSSRGVAVLATKGDRTAHCVSPDTRRLVLWSHRGSRILGHNPWGTAATQDGQHHRKRVLIVYAHQEPRSFNGSLKTVAVEELSRQGCAVTVSDLYAMGFEPRATRQDVVGDLTNPEYFDYGVEVYEACKKRSLASDILAEQRKVQEADLVIFQFPMYWVSVPAILKGWMDRVLCQGFAFEFPSIYEAGFLKGKLALLSLTTGGTAEMYGKSGVMGDIRSFLWPLQHGALHFCGFEMLAPQISFAPAVASEEERKLMVAAWAERLKTIWQEEPIDCSPPWYFQ